MSNGTGYVLNDVLRFTTVDGTDYFHRLDGNQVAASAARNRARGRSRVQPRRPASRWSSANRCSACARSTRAAGATGCMVGVPRRADGAGRQPIVLTPTRRRARHVLVAAARLDHRRRAGHRARDVHPDGSVVLPLLKVRRVDRATRLVAARRARACSRRAHDRASAPPRCWASACACARASSALIVMLRQPARPDHARRATRTCSIRRCSASSRWTRATAATSSASSAAPTRPATTTTTNGEPGAPLRTAAPRAPRRTCACATSPRRRRPPREAIRLGPEALDRRAAVGPASGPARHARCPAATTWCRRWTTRCTVGVDSNRTGRTAPGSAVAEEHADRLAGGRPGADRAPPLQQALIDHCEVMRYRFAVLDGPPPPDDTLADVQAQRQQFDTQVRRALPPVAADPRSVPAPARRRSAQLPDPAVGPRARHLRPHRHRARRAQGAGQRGRARHHRAARATSTRASRTSSTPTR